MTRIICRVSACAFWEHGICGADEIEYELDDGCLTFQELGDLELEEEVEDDADEFDWDDSPKAVLYDDDEDDEDDWDNEDWDDEEEDDDDFDL